MRGRLLVNPIQPQAAGRNNVTIVRVQIYYFSRLHRTVATGACAPRDCGLHRQSLFLRNLRGCFLVVVGPVMWDGRKLPWRNAQEALARQNSRTLRVAPSGRTKLVEHAAVNRVWR